MNATIPPIQVRCAKCGGGMDGGFILEEGHGNSRSVTSWVAGVPQKSFWMGLSLDGRARHDVRALRCRDCGFLELYAP